MNRGFYINVDLDKKSFFYGGFFKLILESGWIFIKFNPSGVADSTVFLYPGWDRGYFSLSPPGS
jgi:hypothetical protein